jgi:hypothetical protein
VVADGEPLEITKALAAAEDAENSDQKEIPGRDADPTSHSDVRDGAQETDQVKIGCGRKGFRQGGHSNPAKDTVSGAPWPDHLGRTLNQPCLHPQVQAELADVFISATQAREDGKPRDVQLIVESHSEHFLNRLQRRVAEGTVQHKDVAVYFCRRAGAATDLEPLKLNMFGEIENWPEHFFGDEMADIAGRTVAAMKRKKDLRHEGVTS